MNAEPHLSANITLMAFYLAIAFFLLGFLLGWIARGKGWVLDSKPSAPAGDPTLRTNISPMLNPTGVSFTESTPKPAIRPSGIMQNKSNEEGSSNSETSSKPETAGADKPGAQPKTDEDAAADQATKDDSLGLVYSQSPENVDDLKDIKGVGKVLSDKLNSFGVYTYRQIAAWDDAIIAEFSTRLSFKDRIKRDDWVAQAKALHKAKYDEELG